MSERRLISLKRVIAVSFRLLKRLVEFYDGHKVIKIGATSLFFAFCLLYLISNFHRILQALAGAEVNVLFLVLALFLTFGIVLLGGVAWWLTLSGFGHKLPFWSGVKVHLNSAITRYTPGYLWQYASKSYLTHNLGISNRVIGYALVWEFAQLIWSGVGISLLLMPENITTRLSIDLCWVVVSRGLGFFLLFVAPFFALVKFPHLLHIEDRNPIMVSYIVFVLSWFGLGLSIGLIKNAFIDLPGSLLFDTFTIAVSMIVGILIIPVPNGLGIREGMMVYLLNFIVPLPVSIIVSITSRLVILIGEIVWNLILFGVSLNPKGVLRTGA